VRDHVADLDSVHGKGNGEEIAVKDAVIIDTTCPIEESVRKIIAICK
jgi:hypothetical protein